MWGSIRDYAGFRWRRLGWGWLQAGLVRCGRLQRTLKDGQVDRRGNCRDVNRLEIGTCAVTLARFAATTRIRRPWVGGVRRRSAADRAQRSCRMAAAVRARRREPLTGSRVERFLTATSVCATRPQPAGTTTAPRSDALHGTENPFSPRPRALQARWDACEAACRAAQGFRQTRGCRETPRA